MPPLRQLVLLSKTEALTSDTSRATCYLGVGVRNISLRLHTPDVHLNGDQEKVYLQTIIQTKIALKG